MSHSLHGARAAPSTMERAARTDESQRLKEQRESEYRELRQSIHAVSREFETTVSRLTDNQEVIKGIQAFVRLITQSANG